MCSSDVLQKLSMLQENMKQMAISSMVHGKKVDDLKEETVDPEAETPEGPDQERQFLEPLWRIRKALCNVGALIHDFGWYWNISAVTGWISVKFMHLYLTSLWGSHFGSDWNVAAAASQTTP